MKHFVHPERWGHLEIQKIHREPLTDRDEHGKSYRTGEFGPVLLDLRCDCGHEFTVPESAFPGKWKMRDCGRAECDFVRARITKRKRPLGRPKTSRGVLRTFSVCLPATTVTRAKRYAEQHDTSFSRALATLAEMALNSIDLETEKLRSRKR